MTTIRGLAERDGWRCWLCEGEIDDAAPPNSPWRATVDHVVPKSRGGLTEPANLRLSHSRCNAARGNHLPELSWPGEFALIDSSPVWQSLSRVLRNRSPEIVAVAPTRELAAAASIWVVEAVERFIGGTWHTTISPAGADTDACTITLEVGVDPDIKNVGKPL
ncbi:MAG: HNH endonuclease [Acidimicrobiales bacterium]